MYVLFEVCRCTLRRERVSRGTGFKKIMLPWHHSYRHRALPSFAAVAVIVGVLRLVCSPFVVLVVVHSVAFGMLVVGLSAAAVVLVVVVVSRTAFAPADQPSALLPHVVSVVDDVDSAVVFASFVVQAGTDRASFDRCPIVNPRLLLLLLHPLHLLFGVSLRILPLQRYPPLASPGHRLRRPWYTSCICHNSNGRNEGPGKNVCIHCL